MLFRLCSHVVVFCMGFGRIEFIIGPRYSCSNPETILEKQMCTCFATNSELARYLAKSIKLIYDQQRNAATIRMCFLIL